MKRLLLPRTGGWVLLLIGLAGLAHLAARPRPQVAFSFEHHFITSEMPGNRGARYGMPTLADFDGDGDVDVFTAEQEDDSILPEGAGPRWFIWENLGDGPQFAEHIIYEGMLGGHDVIVGDVDGDGDPDLASKVWSAWSENANGGGGHADFFENRLR